MSLVAGDLVDETIELVALPGAVVRALERLDTPQASASEIGEIIAEDPVLCSRLLQIVNSSFYGFPSRINTISRAITIVGTLELTDLVLGSSVVDAFSRLPNQLIDPREFWEHSLYAGVVAKLLARYLRAPNTERCFIMGLLHDIGLLVLYRQRPGPGRTAMEQATRNKLPLYLAEREVLGFDHGEVGARLMRAWRLPESFATTALHHHQPSASDRYRLETAVIHLADVITGMAHGTHTGIREAAPLEPGTWELTGLSVDIVEAVVAEADTLFEAARTALLQHSNAA
jgi:putative nucleotidyltransferase with HDIG domain